MKTILVTGANGQLGQELQDVARLDNKFQWIFTSRNEVDITNTESIKSFFHENNIDICINTAAYTAVDNAEKEIEKAITANTTAVKNLSVCCSKHKAKLIHISTDFVFDGTSCRPYVEEDEASPIGVYGETKYQGELVAENAIIIRTSWVYSSYGNNFVKTMLRLGNEREKLSVVFDQIGTPTYALDLAEAIYQIVSDEKNLDIQGVFHYSNEGVCSWYDFATAIFKENKIDCRVSPILSKEYPTPAKRPHYSVLNKSKIKSTFGITIPHWNESLSKCLVKL